jgi:hypothetical protein
MHPGYQQNLPSVTENHISRLDKPSQPPHIGSRRHGRSAAGDSPWDETPRKEAEAWKMTEWPAARSNARRL